jgi:DNA-binding CsgD family transcriptional regulator
VTHMLDDRFASVLAAKDATDFQGQVLRFTKWLGFDLMSAFAAVDEVAGSTEFYSIDNAPQSYRLTFDNLELGYSDPVMQHCKHHGTPILWDQGTYLNSGLGERWEAQAAFGYRVGVGVALHLPGGLHFMIGVDRDQPLPVDAAERRRLAGDLCLFAAFAHETAIELLLPKQRKPEAGGLLSARELEVLRWTADGKTAWELGRILGISEQTVARHVSSAAQKLGCVNKVQAVAKALRLGLVG